jgi:hypothetical protein
MRYMLMICHEGSSLPGPASIDDDPRFRRWSEERERRGIHRGGARLRPAEDATTVRVREEEVLLSDGPFAETKEQMAGYDIIECENLDEAIEVASRHPVARFGSIEMRPLWEE